MTLAYNFLGQAKSLAPTDYLVQTEWAYLNLKRAAQEADIVGSEERAKEAIDTLEAAIAARGRYDAYPYHVLGSQGLGWSRRAYMSRADRVNLLSRLRNLVKEGVANHPKQSELQQLLRDITEEYLLTAV